jgi:AraC-like DNA-binding protein
MKQLAQAARVAASARASKTAIPAQPIEGFGAHGDPQVHANDISHARVGRAHQRIERDLRDPALNAARVAARLRMSPRQLRAVFAAGNETVSGYILRRRLEECARELADPGRRRTAISAIAASWGFDSAPQFTRSFRERFGMSPRQYRACARSLGLVRGGRANECAGDPRRTRGPAGAVHDRRLNPVGRRTARPIPACRATRALLRRSAACYGPIRRAGSSTVAGALRQRVAGRARSGSGRPRRASRRPATRRPCAIRARPRAA